MPPKAPKKDERITVRFRRTINTPYHLIEPGKEFTAKEATAFAEIPERRFAAGLVIQMTPAEIARYGLREKKDYEVGLIVPIAGKDKPAKPEKPASIPGQLPVTDRSIKTPPAR